MDNVPNVWLSITLFNAVARMVSSEIHSPDVIYHYNDAIHSVNAMNRDNTVLKAVQVMRNVHAVKFVQMENAAVDAIQAIVWKVNCVRMELALLAVEIIWIAQVIDHA